MRAEDQGGLMSKQAAAEYCGMSLRSFCRVIDDIPHYKLGESKNSPVRFRKRDLDKYLERFRVEAGAARSA